MKATERQSLQIWDEYIKNLQRETPVPVETEADKAKRIARLKGDFVAFAKYYFPNYASADFAPFHLKIQKKVAAAQSIYICAELAREHAKSVLCGLMIPLFEMVNGRMSNMLLVSHSYDNACELLMPIQVNLEHNQRFVADYGKQRSWREWERGKFVTGQAASFRAIGAGQSPRGTRNEDKRPDFIVVDDIDTDEESRNQERIEKKWQWIEQALWPTMSITGSKRFLVVGNKISKESIIAKASRIADFHIKVNILDAKGKPSWKERYTLEQVQYMLSKISYASGQKEYFNNPITQGAVFKDLRVGKVPPLNRFRLLVAYMDASYRSTASKKGDYKALVLMGMYEGKLYIIKSRLEQGTLAQAIAWFYDLHEFVNDKTAVYNYVEVNGLQDPWYEDVFRPALQKVAAVKGYSVNISADKRSKPDKFSRIEAALEPLNRQGNLIFNEDEIKDPHMQRLKEQFEAIEPSLSAHDDGPDAVEGGYFIANNKLRELTPIKTGTSHRSTKKRF
jgi:hypothetical protein